MLTSRFDLDYGSQRWAGAESGNKTQLSQYSNENWSDSCSSQRWAGAENNRMSNLKSVTTRFCMLDDDEEEEYEGYSTIESAMLR